MRTARPGSALHVVTLAALAILSLAWPARAMQLGGFAIKDPDLALSVVPDDSWSGIPTLYHPVQLLFENRGKTREIGLVSTTGSLGSPISGQQSSESRLELTLPAGEVFVELPLLVPADSSGVVTSVTVDGRRASRLEIHSASVYMDPGWPSFLTLGETPAGLTDILAALGQNAIRTYFVPLSLAASHWQCYLGLPGTVVLSTRDVVSLTAEQKLAISRWVRIGGGNLWLHGSGTGDALQALALSPQAQQRTGEIWLYSTGAGTVTVSRDIDELATILAKPIQDMKAALAPTAVPLDPYDPSASIMRGTAETVLVLDELERSRHRACFYNPRARYNLDISGTGTSVPSSRMGQRLALTLDRLTDGLHDVPRAGYVLISLLFALVIGPLNLLVLTLKKRQALFYVTAPVLAFAGMAMLLGFTIMDEGLTLKRRHVALLMHDPANGDGAMYEAHGTFGGIVPPRRIEYGVETAAVPAYTVTYSGADGIMRLVTSWSPSLTLVSGWTRSRELRSYLTATPVRVRMGMSVTRGPGDEIHVENGLTALARRVLARIVDEEGRETIYRALDVMPGQSARMHPTTDTEDEAMLVMAPFIDLERASWQVVARMEGLPHTTGDVLGGEVVDQRFWYVSLAPARGVEIPERFTPMEKLMEAVALGASPLEVVDLAAGGVEGGP